MRRPRSTGRAHGTQRPRAERKGRVRRRPPRLQELLGGDDDEERVRPRLEHEGERAGDELDGDGDGRGAAVACTGGGEAG